MSWLESTNAIGKTMQHTDGTLGTVLDVRDTNALVSWDDNTESWCEEDFLIYV